ncbi:MAG: M12 family metallo-peptidase, partial [Rhodothermales bacterium]|nr:M12 family metallo-peptidase [Rhodothermales bacterium]
SGGVLLPVPLPDGAFAAYEVIEAPVMAPGLQARYPRIRTYLGRRTDGPGVARISLTPQGFHAMLLGPEGTVFLDPAAPGETEHVIAYWRRDRRGDPERLAAFYRPEGDVVHVDGDDLDAPPAAVLENGDVLRTYRLAVATTGEYTAFHANDDEVDDVEEALAAIAVALNRVNGVYERDLSIRMELVENNDLIIYTDPATDPYSNNNGGTMLGQNQSNLDAVIGDENYDIGHVFSTGGGGIAGLGVVCRTGQKARGVTGLPSPIGDTFYIDYVAHEVGHQFRANHSFNGSAGNCAGGNRNGATAYEPGSGSTIMAYAGICGSHNIAFSSDDYFHFISLQEIVSYTNFQQGSTCGTVTDLENDIPEITLGEEHTVPALTPFSLTGAATDATPETLTYTWEERDLGPAGPPPTMANPVNTPPFFRSFDPEPGPTRYFPQLDRLLAGLPPVNGEGLPTAEVPTTYQTLDFRLTVRDNHPGGGAINDEDLTLLLAVDAGPFVVTSQSTGGELWVMEEAATVTWDVAGTDVAPVEAATVDILLSDDGGETFAYVLALATPNDGMEEIVVPALVSETSEARVMVRASENVFFNVNDEDFSILFEGVGREASPEASHRVSAVYPNPFGLGPAASARATVNVEVDRAQAVEVALYDALGRRVATLFHGPLAAGQNRQVALDAHGLAAGSYFVRVTGETFADVRPVTVVR